MMIHIIYNNYFTHFLNYREMHNFKIKAFFNIYKKDSLDMYCIVCV